MNKEKRIAIADELKRNMAVLLFPVMTLLILSPLEVYQGNQGEVKFAVQDFIGVFLLIGIITLLLAGMLLSFLPVRLQKICRTVLFACSVMAYLQNLFLNRQLMRTDGSKMDWGSLRGYTVLNSAVWCLGLLALSAGCYFLKQKRDKVIAGASLFVSSIELVAVVSLLIALPSGGDSEVTLLDGSGQMSLAKGTNIIVFILDRYGNVTFENGYEREEDFLDVYKDFTFYENANSTYNYTFPSVTYMLTQEPVDCSLTTSGYKQKAWEEGLSEEFHDRLEEQGYAYHFYTGSGSTIFADASDLQESVDNTVTVSTEGKLVETKTLAFLLLKTSLYKHAPYFLKPYLEVLNYFYEGVVSYPQAQPVEDNGEYYELLQSEGLSVDPQLQNLFVINHLSGIHTPYTIGADGNPVEENDTDLEECQKGINVILGEYMEQLKELGLYDDSVIIITADHGLYVDSLDPQPIFLIKMPGQVQEEMTVSDAPISTEDFLPTILECAGADTEGFGTPISAWQDGDTRERKCCYPRDGFDVYTYQTDREQLRDEIREGNFDRMEAAEDWD